MKLSCRLSHLNISGISRHPIELTSDCHMIVSLGNWVHKMVHQKYQLAVALVTPIIINNRSNFSLKAIEALRHVPYALPTIEMARLIAARQRYIVHTIPKKTMQNFLFRIYDEWIMEITKMFNKSKPSKYEKVTPPPSGTKKKQNLKCSLNSLKIS